jgi:thymidylate synthase (FAD)
MSDKIDFLNDGKSFVSLVDRMIQDHALKVTNAARSSYDKEKLEFDKKDQGLTRFLWDEEHTSPYRHSYYTFQIKLPLFVARQLMKYQVGSGFRTIEANGEEVFIEEFDHLFDIDKGCSWNEVSGRYTQTSTDFYTVSSLRSNPGHGNKQSSGDYLNPINSHNSKHLTPKGIIRAMEFKCKNDLDFYYKLIENGVAREIARMHLPQNIYTKAYWTLSLQSVIWFLHQRLKPDAQYEIRMLAESVYNLIKDDLDRLGIIKEKI